jgi:uncharacterized protein (DUF433 family)
MGSSARQPKETGMIALPETVALPLKMDEHGTIRVSGTRVTLDTVIACYHQGDSPEAIHEGFDVLPLNDIYAVIAYYLAHRDELDAYLKRGQEESERLRQEWEASYTPEQKAFNERIRKLAEEKRRQRNG